MSNSEISTSTNAADPKTTGPRRTGRWRLLLRFTLAAILLLLVLHLTAGWAARAKLRQARERVAGEGQSLRFSDYAPPDVPESENASDFLEAAGLLLGTLPREGGATVVDELARRFQEIDRERAAPTPEDLELFRRAVDGSELALSVLDEGMSRQRARFDADYYTSRPFSLDRPNLLLRLQLASLLRARTWLALEGGHPAAAYREVGKMFRLAGWIAEEMPVPLHPLFATLIARQALATTEALMQRASPTAEEMAHLSAEARRWDPEATYEHSLAADRAAMSATVLDESAWQALAAEIAPFPMTSGVARAALDPWIDANAAVLSDAMTAMIETCRAPPYLRRSKASSRSDEPLPKWAALARIVSYDVAGICARSDVLIPQLDLMEIAFRLEEHRRETGGYPESLDLLPGAPGPDPWSGEPYRYRLDDAGAVVYSVGGNRVDDGGTPPAPGMMMATPELHDGDIVWRLPLTP